MIKKLKSLIPIFLDTLYINIKINSRKLYTDDKKMAAIARKIESGQEVQPLSVVSLETASWLATKGEGWRKHIYRYCLSILILWSVV